MSIERIAFTNSPKDDKYLNLSDEEIVTIHDKIRTAYYTHLKDYGVLPLWKEQTEEGEDQTEKSAEEVVDSLDAAELQLVFLYKYKGKLVHKDLISAFVRKYKPQAGLDQQIRHIGSQCFWYVLNRGAKIPDMDDHVPSGFHYLVSIESPNPKVIASSLKRKGRLAAENFDELVLTYDNKCATCGIEQGKKDPRTNKIVKLQQGHMNPREKLTLKNTIPQCEYCNQTYKDYFQFNENGRIIAVINPKFLLNSPEDVQDQMIEVLKAEQKKRKND